jgi:SAM-dependent methyltransferase
MANASCVLFVARSLVGEEYRSCGLSAVEVGSWSESGGYRALTELCGGFSEYIGVDVLKGPGVDIVCDATELAERFPDRSFDVVIATELLEHVFDWRRVVSNLKQVCRLGGTIIVTTRSRGYGYHAVPYDFWRFDVSDCERIFSDCHLLDIETDPEAPGVFVKVKIPVDFKEADLSGIDLYSMVLRRRATVEEVNVFKPRPAVILLAAKMRQFLGWLFSEQRSGLRTATRQQVLELKNLFALSRRSMRL